MHRFVIKAIFFVCIQILILMAISYYLATQSQGEYLAASRDKHRLLQETPSPKIVLVGGSSLSFGMDSEMIAQKFPDYHPVNMGHAAGVGLDLMLREISHELGPGDIVILAPEYEHFFQDYTNSEFVLFIIASANPAIIQHFRWPQWRALMRDGFAFIHYLIRGAWNRARGQLPQNNVPFDQDDFNVYGDLVKHQTMPSPGIREQSVLGLSDNPTQLSRTIQRINQFHDQMLRKGVRVALTFPPVSETYYQRYQPQIHQVEKTLQHMGYVTLLSFSKDTVYPTDHFFNSHYHLNKVGIGKRMQVILPSLQRYTVENPAHPVRVAKNNDTMMITTIHRILIFCGALGTLYFAWILFWPWQHHYQPSRSPYCPYVNAIIPCKGSSAEFEQMLQSLARQDYLPLRYLFCVDHPSDAAVETIQRVFHSFASHRFQIYVSAPMDRSSFKIQNMCEGLRNLDPQAEVIVFLDSDGTFQDDYIRTLIAPLQDPRYTASSCNRTYHATSLGGLLVKYWNAISQAIKQFPPAAFVWGGACAIRREDLKALDIPRVWQHALAEDMITTRRVQEMRGRIFSVPRRATSLASHRLKDAFAWITRQEYHAYQNNQRLNMVNTILMVIFLFYLGMSFISGKTGYLIPHMGVMGMIAGLALKAGTMREIIMSPITYALLIMVVPYTYIKNRITTSIDWAGVRYDVDKAGQILRRHVLAEPAELVSHISPMAPDVQFELGRIHYAINFLKNLGRSRLANTLQQYIQALLVSESLPAHRKEILIDQLALIVSRYSDQEDLYNPKVIQVLLKTVSDTLHSAQDLEISWSAFKEAYLKEVTSI